MSFIFMSVTPQWPKILYLCVVVDNVKLNKPDRTILVMRPAQRRILHSYSSPSLKKLCGFGQNFVKVYV